MVNAWEIGERVNIVDYIRNDDQDIEVGNDSFEDVYDADIIACLRFSAGNFYDSKWSLRKRLAWIS